MTARRAKCGTETLLVGTQLNIRKVHREMLKTSGFALGFLHLPRDIANVNEWKIMFDPYNQGQAIAFFVISIDSYHLGRVRSWAKLDNTLYFSVPLNVEFYSGENAEDTITPLTRTDIKSWTNLILGQIKFQPYLSIDFGVTCP